MYLVTVAAFVATLSGASAVHLPWPSTQCPVVFDGRVPVTANGTTFDAGQLPYNNLYDLGANLTWADVLLFPHTQQSLFDDYTTKAVEVTIDDLSIFTPSPTNAQTGFRRAELLPVPANATYAATGIKTLHWSTMADSHRPLNYSHEYQLVWLENKVYSADQFTIGTGTIYGSTGVSEEDAKVLFVRGTDAASPQVEYWRTEFTVGVWHNFGIVLDFDENQIEVLYSQGELPLEKKTKFAAGDLSGLGEYHFGVLKKPTGNVTDITKEGYQESGIHEGIAYGGIFEEDSASGCVSLAPWWVEHGW